MEHKPDIIITQMKMFKYNITMTEEYIVCIEDSIGTEEVGNAVLYYQVLFLTGAWLT